MARRATRGRGAQFTYDFGISIAQSTVNKLARLTGVTLSLASAFYALRNTATEYVSVLRENTLRFGGVLSTMQAMQQAQDRLITGMSRFDVRDQMEGMNQLMAAGVNVKKNMDWIEKAAHATGKSFAQFSGMIAGAVQGNLQGLVDAGLMTQRATKAFSRFQGNSLAMQRHVLEFLKNHKGLLSAIKNDFMTIEDGVRRLRAVVTSFLQSIIGKPNDPNSLYGSIAKVVNMIADKFGKDGVLSKNMIMLRQYGEGVGVVMSWVVRKVGELIVWLARQVKKVAVFLLGPSDTFAERMRSLVVWLEFWKLKVIDILEDVVKAIVGFYKKHETLIKAIGAVLIAYLAWGAAWKMITKGTLLIEGMTLGLRALRKSIMAAGGAWTFFSKMMTVGMFRTARNRSFFRLFGLTPYKVNAWFLNLGAGAAASFSKGFAVVRTLTMKTWTGMLAAMRTAWFASSRKMLLGFMLMWNGLVDAIVKWFKFSWALWNKPTVALKMLGNGFKWLFGLVLRFFKSFKYLLTLILNLPKLLANVGNGIKGVAAAVGATNPVGWIILAITLLTVLYSYCEKIRLITNTYFKMWWEFQKTQWNILYGLFVGVCTLIKSVWVFLKNYIITPLINFFKSAIVWIGEMWSAFMNTAVGKFINNYIVSPLKTAFEWIIKAWNWLIKGMSSVLKIMSLTNDSLADNIDKMAEGVGLPKWGAKGGNYDTNDTTDYLSPKNWGLSKLFKSSGGGDAVVALPKNPLVGDIPSGGLGGGEKTTNNISLSNGAVQIIVPKEVNIDEAKLARMVRDEIRNLDRENGMRGGDI